MEAGGRASGTDGGGGKAGSEQGHQKATSVAIFDLGISKRETKAAKKRANLTRRRIKADGNNVRRQQVQENRKLEGGTARKQSNKIKPSYTEGPPPSRMSPTQGTKLDA